MKTPLKWARSIFAIALYFAFVIGNYYLLNAVPIGIQTPFIELVLFCVAFASIRMSLGKTPIPKDKFTFTFALASAFALAFAFAFAED